MVVVEVVGGGGGGGGLVLVGLCTYVFIVVVHTCAVMLVCVDNLKGTEGGGRVT